MTVAGLPDGPFSEGNWFGELEFQWEETFAWIEGGYLGSGLIFSILQRFRSENVTLTIGNSFQVIFDGVVIFKPALPYLCEVEVKESHVGKNLFELRSIRDPKNIARNGLMLGHLSDVQTLVDLSGLWSPFYYKKKPKRNERKLRYNVLYACMYVWMCVCECVCMYK